MSDRPTIGIDLLLLAAKQLDEPIDLSSKEERLPAADDHGYASSSPRPKSNSRSRRRTTSNQSSSSSNQGGRSTHNQKEKFRRAGMKDNLSKLQSLVPNATGDRQTTLHTLRKATHHITDLARKLEKREAIYGKLILRKKSLEKRLFLLQEQQPIPKQQLLAQTIQLLQLPLPLQQFGKVSMVTTGADNKYYTSESDLMSSDEEEINVE